MVLIHKRIREIIDNLGLSVQSLEKRAGLKRGAIQNILSGKSRNPTIYTLQAISHALGCPLTDITDKDLSSVDPLVSNKEQGNMQGITQSPYYLIDDNFPDKEIGLYVHCCVSLYEFLKQKNIFLSVDDFSKLIKEVFFMYSHFDEKLKFTNNKKSLEELIEYLLWKSGKISSLSNKGNTDIVYTSILNKAKLTQREYQCLHLLTEGMSAKQMSHTLKISPRTVEAYIEKLKNKMGCYNKSLLIQKALTMFSIKDMKERSLEQEQN